MVQKIVRSEAPRLLATLRKRSSLVVTPVNVLMSIGITAPRNTTTTLDQMPIPNQMTMSGSRVTRGTAFKTSMNGLSRK